MYFPQSSTRGARPSRQTEKLFFYPFWRKHVLFDRCTSCPKRCTRITGSVDVDRPSELLFADSIKWRADQRSGLCVDTCSFTVTVRHGGNHPRSPSELPGLNLIILGSSSIWRTYAGLHCLEFYQQSECSWRLWRPPASGSKQRNDQLLHMSDSTCIQKRDTFSSKRKHIKPLWDDISPESIN